MTAETITKTAYLNASSAPFPTACHRRRCGYPNASYTVGELINLIEAEQNNVGSGTASVSLPRLIIMPQGKGTYGSKKGRPQEEKE